MGPLAAVSGGSYRLPAESPEVRGCPAPPARSEVAPRMCPVAGLLSFPGTRPPGERGPGPCSGLLD